MASKITDERTLAAWLSSPTEARAKAMHAVDQDPLIYVADVEEHVADSETGVTKRCDLTLRSRAAPVCTMETKRPEVAQVTDPQLLLDAWKKAIARGLPYFLTCNFAQVAVWDTAWGSNQKTPVSVHELVDGLTHSAYAPHRREELSDGWTTFLDDFTPVLSARLGRTKTARPLPAEAVDLRNVIQSTAEETASRIRARATDSAFREIVLEAFRAQFGVEFLLDPYGETDRFIKESIQIALIGVFVVAMRLVLYQALVVNGELSGTKLEPLDIVRNTTDPRRIEGELTALYEHAHRRTGDFEVQFSPNALDWIVFIDAPSDSDDVGSRWGTLIDVIRERDWTGPASYVPGLYESLLDDAHRHVMGVHYTSDTVAELVTCYAVRDATDIVMDPASGAGTFVTMGYERKRALGSTHQQALGEVYAIEIADFAASLTGLSLTLADSTAESAYPRVIREDFFRTGPGRPSKLSLPDVGLVSFPKDADAVIGNPPYIRFENRTADEREEVLKFLQNNHQEARTAYPNFTGKADLWAFFVAGSEMYLKPGGRLGFVLSWNLLASEYGDAVLSFLGRYFAIDAIIDSKVERWFAAKQNTVLLLARKLKEPANKLSSKSNPNLPAEHLVHFIRLKRPLEELLDKEQPRGKRAEDLVDDILSTHKDVGDDLRWDIRVFSQEELVRRSSDDVDLGDASGS